MQDFRYLSLKEKEDVWADRILDANRNETVRQEAWKKIGKAGYSIIKEVINLENYYTDRIGI